MPGPALGDANSPITESIDQARKLCGGVTTTTRLDSTDRDCTYIEITAFETNAEPIMVGGSSVKLGTTPAYTARVGGGVLFPGQKVLIATPNSNLWYISGLATDWVSWTLHK